MKSSYLKLKNIEYNIESSSVNFYDIGNCLKMYIEISASNSNVEYELSHLMLYHNNGFLTDVKKIKDLKGKNFIWNSEKNERNEDAGNLYVVEHEEITEGCIEILNCTNSEIEIKWTGKANIFWNEELGENVPFESIIIVPLPKTKNITIDAYKNVNLRIDKNTEIQLLNFKEIEIAAEKMQVSGNWKDFNVTLHFKVIFKGKEYLGDVKYIDGKNNFETYFDSSCPFKVEHDGFCWSTVLNYFEFNFKIIK